RLRSSDLNRRRRRPDAQLALTDDRVDASNVTLDSAQASVALPLASGRLEAQVEEFLFGLLQFVDEPVVFERVELCWCELLGSDRHYASPSSRLMMRAFNGSLWMARVSASRAMVSSTPASSNITRPGLTLATHHSTEPLPEPMRVSAGFLVSGRSGKMLIQTLPPRLMWRVIAISPASICRLVTYAPSTAWMPYSPNVTLVPPLARPLRFGWCCLRCLTLRGISMGYSAPLTLRSSLGRRSGLLGTLLLLLGTAALGTAA